MDLDDLLEDVPDTKFSSKTKPALNRAKTAAPKVI